MTARDEAIAAMYRAGEGDTDFYYVGEDACGLLLDAVPAGVLARLAIERGALELVDPYHYLGDDVLLYRLTES